ncbi:carbohydrate ABC transporter permease [Paenibacillus mendelii]|uniref:Carbohydrate ABC transporter permease n=1 Tax=Paenibacillus mendelii TaxID=206163 RepID=A0ABV6JLF4_9BACL|nr:carbohydrate ABC transporter permease [Paenibacillus mendelii]MCQ6562332.1 carbohydrate ABC transporter permease [Paenibacillus mendelii]
MALKTRGEAIFEIVNYILLSIVIVACLLPLLNIAAKSFSSEAYVLAGEIFIWPKGFSVQAYEIVLGSRRFWTSFGNTVFITVVGTALNTMLTIFAGYALSRKRLRGQSVIMFLFIFSMLFSGGIIPTYLIVKEIGLLNSLWALIIPGLVAPFNMIIMRLYFYNIPDSMEESAKIDGASHFRILFSIMIPLAMPSIATISLFYAVEYWNNYFDALIYLNKHSLFPLQVYLREIILNASSADVNNIDLMMNTAQESVRGATVVAATLPILVVYPFLQKHFVKGAMLGAVKQ